MSVTVSRAVEIFGSNTFSTRTMKQWLPSKNYKELMQVLAGKGKLTPELAAVVANTMKSWAISKGTSHYCHWFHPMTGSTAEKHDAFLDLEGDWGDKSPIDRFSGSVLLQSEPDASSFPSGGMRTTFEARGYTTWDPSSPAFIIDEEGSSTLCIPSLFYSYHGTVMDLKMPLLRSLKCLDIAGRNLLRTLGHDSNEPINAYLGIEQEFFLIEQQHFKNRIDLVITGRTLLGAPAPKEQELGDHYFGRLPPIVLRFMEMVQEEAYKLGIPIKTRHNEVAPRQFEIAPIFEPTNIATDHNILLMNIMKRIASKIGLELLLHEKPFSGMNGSGKHNNWSIGGAGRGNLLEPGDTPEDNLEFLVFLVCAVSAVNKRAGLLRASIACLGNDSRLGGDEAPPSIMSVYLGEHLDFILNSIETESVAEFDNEAILHLGLSHIETIGRDSTDRNRTSPFAFTGNKFEFRAVPSSIPCSFPNTVLNLAMSEAMDSFNEKLKGELEKEKDRKKAILNVIKSKIIESKRIRFEGDGYSSQWHEEAQKRGLNRAKNSFEAFKEILTHEDLFTRYSVMYKDEVQALYIIKLEQFVACSQIEIRTLIQMCNQQIIPAGLQYQAEIADTLTKSTSLLSQYGSKRDLTGVLFKTQIDYLENVSTLVSKLMEATNDLQVQLAEQELDTIEAKAEKYVSVLLPQSLKLRSYADELEKIVSKKVWPIPTYTDLLCDTLDVSPRRK